MGLTYLANEFDLFHHGALINTLIHFSNYLMYQNIFSNLIFTSLFFSMGSLRGRLVATIFVIRFFPQKNVWKNCWKNCWKICWKIGWKIGWKICWKMLDGNLDGKCWVENWLEMLVENVGLRNINLKNYLVYSIMENFRHACHKRNLKESSKSHASAWTKSYKYIEVNSQNMTSNNSPNCKPLFFKDWGETNISNGWVRHCCPTW